MQRFFLQEVQKGEELLSEGNFEEAVEHLSNAIAVCGQPQQLLAVLQQTLPPQVFHMLLQRLPVVSARITRTASSSAMLAEEDVE
ncbi:PREDICTED: mitochondrial import receptor subunit TOM20 homolog [Priapulus caudatus]|uniref:Mitochondrial import receptor subunit TOM20 homolog n=1 Tax=Priapulus caudatus TaxID=37621 RepID=A0ABM1F5V7_PRICU|nr:PREDICTED: mitochondrial import receptor subunit TOM20 homolog [Priapulus caudatus]